MPELFQVFTGFGMAGVVAWIVWWMFTKQIPTREEAFERTLKEQRDDFRAVLREELAKVVETCDKLNETMAAHDARFKDRLPKCMSEE